jgi:putative flippase GtrA
LITNNPARTAATERERARLPPLGRAWSAAHNPLAARMGRAFVVSVAVTLLSACVLVVLTVAAGVRPATANFIAVMCGIGPQYIGLRRYAWGCDGVGSLSREITPFWTLSIVGLVGSTLAVGQVATWSHGWSESLRAVALPATNLAFFAALFLVRFFVCDRFIFRPATPRP